MRILLVDDDKTLAIAVSKTLAALHYIVDVAGNSEKGLELINTFPYDLILLDVMLPKVDGISFCRQLRDRGLRIPILLLTARDQSTDKVRGLDAGADDYLIKPFNWEEFLARIRTLLRRGNSPLLPVLEWNNLCLSPSNCQVTYKNQNLNLTPTEYRILELLLRNNRRVFSSSNLIEHLWSFDNPPGEETVRSHIKGLRMKIRAVGGPGDFIETLYGLGYRLNPRPSEPKLKEEESKGAREQGRRGAGEQGSRGAGEQGKNSHSPTIIASKSAAISLESRQEATLAMLASVWERFKPNILQEVGILEQCITAAESGTLSQQLYQQATTEAHKLAGLLGTLGFPEGSHIAREIENLLRHGNLADLDLISNFRQLIATLYGVLQEPLPQQQATQIGNNNYQPITQSLAFSKQIVSLSENNLDKRHKLLIVDQDLAFTEKLSSEAISLSLRVEIANSLSAARNWLAQNNPDAIVLDLEFPTTNENGLSLLEELNALMPNLPIIVSTVRNDFTDRLEVARLGARAFLHKPIPPAQVLATVTQLLQQEQTESAKILVVDDDSRILNLLSTLLDPWQLKLTTLKDPRQFWETLERVLPDLVILDVEMPHLNGIELCQVVRNDPTWGGLPILFLTAHCDPHTIQRVFAAGADDFVSKPIVGPELVSRIVIRLERVRLLRQLAETDPLTRLANRTKLSAHLRQFIYLAECTNLPICFAILDLDNFKQINDRYGYEVGDTALRWVGGLVRRAFRGHHEIVARWAGEEFVVVMYGMNKAAGANRLNDLLSLIGQQKFTSSGVAQCDITFSAGVAQYPDDGTDLQSLYRSADTALNQAKISGRNQILPLK